MIVVPQRSKPTTAGDGCIRQYRRIAHYRTGEGFPPFFDIATKPLHKAIIEEIGYHLLVFLVFFDSNN